MVLIHTASDAEDEVSGDSGSSAGEADDDSVSGEGSASDGDKSEGEDGEESAPQDNNPNAGWAEAMAKILHKKTPESRPTILLKNKELDKVKAKEKKELLEKKKQLDKRREWEGMSRVKPDVVQDRETERNLQRIATRGVVQLFNAVRKHQKNIDEKVKEVGASERKRAKLLSSVSKTDFINVLRGTEAAAKPDKSKQVEVKTEEKASWSILRDDFMMGATMKDWDKESDDGIKKEPQDDDYDSDSD
ncbi:RRP15 protein, partial [Amia calva]|nr:RRP15 protein [Amia calva]